MGAYWSYPYHRPYRFYPHYYRPHYYNRPYYPYSPLHYYVGDARVSRDRDPSDFHPGLIGSMVDAIQRYQTTAASRKHSEDDLRKARTAAVDAAKSLGSSIDVGDAQPILVSHVLLLIDFTDAVVGGRSPPQRQALGEDRERVEHVLEAANPHDGVQEAWGAHLQCSTSGFCKLLKDVQSKNKAAIDAYGRRQEQVSAEFTHCYDY